MLITIYSSKFHPSVGGMETVAMQLALSFTELGTEVVLLTETITVDPESDKELPFLILRRPDTYQRWKWVWKSDAILHNAVSLRALFPDILFRRKFYVMHQTWYSRGNFIKTILASLKLVVCYFTNNIYISQAIAEHIGKKGIVINNPYDHRLFKKLPDITRSKQAVFLGRLVLDKGCALLIEAISLLKQQGKTITLTIIGEGPEEEYLKYICTQHELTDQVVFLGKRQGIELVEELNRHKMMVIPSVWAEPFGIVALEGWGCGCFVIGSEEGGLKEAVGSCGLTFKNNNVKQLALAIEKGLSESEHISKQSACIADHLDEHSAIHIAKQYLYFFKRNC